MLGHLAGARGAALFETMWAQVLDAAMGQLMQLAMDARRLGFLDMSLSGGVVDIAFRRLLNSGDRQQTYGQN